MIAIRGSLADESQGRVQMLQGKRGAESRKPPLGALTFLAGAAVLGPSIRSMPGRQRLDPMREELEHSQAGTRW